MNNLQIFKNNEFGDIRIMEKDGKVYAVGSDVAKALGYAIPSKAVNTHCKGVSKMEVPTNGGIQEMLIITEGDIYRLIAKSKLPSAENFESWVFDEVLPTIRKHGAYMTDNVIDVIYNDPQAMIDLLTKLKEEKEARVEAERRNNILMHTNKTYTTTEIAKELGFRSAIALNKDLCDKGIQYKVNNTYVLYSDYADLGYVSIKQQILDNGKEVYNRHFTQDGREFILNLYK